MKEESQQEEGQKNFVKKKQKNTARDLLGYIAYYAGPNRKYIIAGCSLAIIFTVAFLYQVNAFSPGYVVSTAEGPLFVVTDQKQVESVVDDIEKEIKNQWGFDLDFSEDLTFEEEKIKNTDVPTTEEIRLSLEAHLLNQIDAAAIVIDGEASFYLESQEAAEAVLAQLKEEGAAVSEEEILKDVFLKEDIEIQDCKTQIRKLVTVEDALETIRMGEERPLIYTIESGDNLWTIARNHGLDVDEIALMNDINKNALLSIGQELVLSRSEPLISVVATVESVETETIPFETELKEDNSVNGIKIAQEGENGEKVVAYSATRVNGITTDKIVVSETVTKEAQNRVVLRGSQITTASRGITRSAGAYSGDAQLTYPTSGTITQYFGRHTGLDIANRIGTPIVAADDGIVTYVHYSNYSYGNYVVIDHLNGLVTRYAHCNELFVDIGQEVSAGETIASMGNTGNSTGPHLHFEVLINGAFVNPLSYL